MIKMYVIYKTQEEIEKKIRSDKALKCTVDVVADVASGIYNILHKKCSYAVTPSPRVSLKHKKSVDKVYYMTLEDAKKEKFITPFKLDWECGINYITHPFDDKKLIPQKLYKDYIINDLFADISNYIQDNIQIHNLGIGVVSTKSTDISNTIPVEKFNINAKLKCKLEKKYTVKFTGGKNNVSPSDRYNWIDFFCDLKSAVTKRNDSFEKICQTSFNFETECNFQEYFNSEVFAEKNMTFYIYYN